MDNVERLVLPNQTKDLLREYGNSLNQNPYTDYKELGPLAAKELIHLLEHTQRHGKEEFQRTHAQWLLEEIEKQSAGKDHPAVLVSNFLIDDLTGIKTPTKKGDFGSNGKGLLSEISQLAFNVACGMEPLCFDSISGGNPFQHISPREGEEKGSGSRTLEALAVHNDGVFREEADIPH